MLLEVFLFERIHTGAVVVTFKMQTGVHKKIEEMLAFGVAILFGFLTRLAWI